MRGRLESLPEQRVKLHFLGVTISVDASRGEPSGYFVVRSGASKLLVDEAPWWLRLWMTVYRWTNRHPSLRRVAPRPIHTFVDRGLVEERWISSDHPESLLVQRHWELAIRTGADICWRFVRTQNKFIGSLDITSCPKNATWRGEVLVGERRQVVDACDDHTDGISNLRSISG
jgi:hypothetical protein